MKSLFRIIRRYVANAVLLVLFVIAFNIIATFFILYRLSLSYPTPEAAAYSSASEQLDEISREISYSEGICRISDQGRSILEQSQYVWAMLLGPGGNVVWSWHLPEEFADSYSIPEVAQFSRWYLNDYPTRIWESGDHLLVTGEDRDSIFRINLVYTTSYVDSIKIYVVSLIALNLVLILSLALWFGYRFYRSLRPLAKGIESMADSRPVLLPERGITEELSRELNKTSRMLDAQNEKLKKRDDARTEWISGVSHDIRTPLALIIGYAESLASDADLREENRQRSENIRRQGILIKQLIQDLNLTSKLEYNAQPLHKVPYSPAFLLRETAAEYYNDGLSDEYEIEIRIAPEVEAVRLDGDVSLIKRALRNIIGNSIRHNPDGCRIQAELFMDLGSVVWRFSDTGPGIPQNVVDCLKGRPVEGLHVMGLRIVQQIVTAHGGRIFFPQGQNGMHAIEFVVN